MADFADPTAEPPQYQKPEWYSPTISGDFTDDQMADGPDHGNQMGCQAGPSNVQYPPQTSDSPIRNREEKCPVSTHSDLVEVMDPLGDLILVVGPEKHEFLVCSRTTRRASSVFERLYDEQRFRGADGQNRLDLSHIGVQPMQVVLQVIHGSPTKVYPKMNDVNLLHDVLVITNHFNMTKCLAPIGVKWLKRIYNKEPTRFQDIAVQMWITYQLGHLNCVKQTIHNMVVGGRLNSKGHLIGQGAGENDEYRAFPTLASLNILDRVQECRLRVIAHLVNIVRDSVQDLTQSPRQPTPINTNGPPPRPNVCRIRGEPPTRKRQCDCRMLGALHRAMYEVSWEKVDYQSISPQSLHRRILEISRQTLREYEPPSEAHRRCEPFGGRSLDLLEITAGEVDKVSFNEQDFFRRGQEMGFSKLMEK